MNFFFFIFFLFCFFFFFFFFLFFFFFFFFFFFQAEDGIRAADVTGVQTCALPISRPGAIAPLRPSSPASRAGAAHIHPARSARVWPRRRAADQSSGRPSCSELIPFHAPRKSLSSRRLRSGGQGEWSEHIIDRLLAARAVQSRSWLTAERIGGAHLNVVAPSGTRSAASVR